MYLNKLEESERVAFLDLAAILIREDGVNHFAELECLNFYKIEGRINWENQSKTLAETKVDGLFDTPLKKKFLIAELFHLSYADGRLHEKEIGLIENVGRILGFNAELLNEIKSKVEENIYLITCIKEIISKPVLNENDKVKLKEIEDSLNGIESYFS